VLHGDLGRRHPRSGLLPVADVLDRRAANFEGYTSPEVDALLLQGRGTRSSLERLKVYQRAERLVLRDAPIVPLFHPLGAMVVLGNVRGLELTPMGVGNLAMENVWFASGAGARPTLTSAALAGAATPAVAAPGTPAEGRDRSPTTRLAIPPPSFQEGFRERDDAKRRLRASVARLRSRLGLQGRFIVFFGLIVLTLMALVVWLVENRMSTTLMQQTRMRGLAIGRSIAATVQSELLSYDYVSLQQAAETARTTRACCTSSSSTRRASSRRSAVAGTPRCDPR